MKPGGFRKKRTAGLRFRQNKIPPEKGQNMKRSFLIISAAVLLLGGAAAGFWYFQSTLKDPAALQSAEDTQTAAQEADTSGEEPETASDPDPLTKSDGTDPYALTGSESAVGTEEDLSAVLGEVPETAQLQAEISAQKPTENSDEIPAQESADIPADLSSSDLDTEKKTDSETAGTPSEKRRKFQTVSDFQKNGTDVPVSGLDPLANTIPGLGTNSGPGNVSGSGMDADGSVSSTLEDPYMMPPSGFQPNAARSETGTAGETSSFAVSAFPAADRNASTSRILVNSVPREVENGLIIPIYEVDVPAEEAGVMRKLYVQDFAQIQKDDVLVQIDDRQAVMAVNVAEAKKESAEIQMKNDVNVRYAIAAHAVADAEIKKADEANSKVKNTVPVVEYNRLVLSRTQAELQIEQAQQELKVAAQNYNVAMAELDAAKLDQTKFEIHSPHDGVVMELYRKEGEWLKPGDPILRLVQMNPIRYSFRIESKTPPESIFNRPVTIYVPTLEKEFSGKVTFIKPSHDIGDMYQVWVDIENTWQAFEDPGEEGLQKGYWILQPGMRAEVKSIGTVK